MLHVAISCLLGDQLLKDTCGQCQFFGTEACSLKSDSKCVDFERKKKAKKERRVEKVSGLSEQGWYEAIYNKNGEPCFAVLKNGEFSLLESVSVNGKSFYPKERQKFPYEPYAYYLGQVPTREDLFWKVRTEFHSFVDLEPTWLEVLSSCVLLSYQQEKLLTVPYIYVFGDNESGKTTVLQILYFLCYRPLFGVRFQQQTSLDTWKIQMP